MKPLDNKPPPAECCRAGADVLTPKTMDPGFLEVRFVCSCGRYWRSWKATERKIEWFEAPL